MIEPGRSIGPYRIIEPIGRGGMATVYRAYEAALDRYVALKVLPPEFLHDPTFSERFHREARLVARLEHHSIIPIHSFGIDDGVPWMAMRLLSGGTLASMIRQQSLTRRAFIGVLREVSQALDHAHKHGVLHRDIKPQNILIDEQGHAYLTDFGVARMVDGSPIITRSGIVSGTPQYMSPEQARSEGVDQRSDIYALGIVAYEGFTGRVPFTADTPVAVLMKHVMEPIPIPAATEVPEALMRPILKALAKNPDDRWRSAVDFVKALDAVIKDDGSDTIHSAPTSALQTPIADRRTPPPCKVKPRSVSKEKRPRQEIANEESKRRQDMPRWPLVIFCISLAILAGSILLYMVSARYAASRDTVDVADEGSDSPALAVPPASPMPEKDCATAESCYQLAELSYYGEGPERNIVWAAELYQQACDLGKPKGCSALGHLYEYGQGVTANLQVSASYYRKGCDAGNVEGCVGLGLLRVKARVREPDIETAAAFLQKGCEAGIARGCTGLGLMAKNGLGRERHYPLAAEYFRRGCEGEDWEGCTLLGLMYDEGQGVSRDFPKAAALLDKACSHNDPEACQRLAFLYEQGRIGPANKARAIQLYTMACQRGMHAACTSIERLR